MYDAQNTLYHFGAFPEIYEHGVLAHGQGNQEKQQGVVQM